MLRVITKREAAGYRLELHGTLGGPWVQVLDQHWRSILDTAPDVAVTVVLSSVDFIDAAGERLLQRMADGGVDFVVSGCLNRYVIEHLRPAVGATKSGRR
jgi:hypothetical protein